MRFLNVKDLLTRKPFRPLRFVMSDGVAHEIRRPDQAIASRAYVEVTSPAATGDVNLAQYLSFLHIVRIEELPRPPAAPPQAD